MHMVTLDARAKRERRSAVSQAAFATALAAALATAIFIFDVSLPLGVAGGVPYVALVLLGLWSPWRPAVLVLASVATALTVIGYGLSPAGGVVWMALANRALAVFAIWVAAVLIFERRKSDDALTEAQAELERRVDMRTAELRDANETLAREVIERKRAETTLRTSETRLRHAQRIASLGHWEWYPRAIYLHLSPEIGLILGVAAEDLPTHKSQFCEAFVHPDDRDHYIATTTTTLDAAVDYRFEYRVVRPDGEVRWLLELSEITHDEFGRRVGMSGTIQDITPRKHAEAKLRQWGMQLAHAQRLAKLGHWSWNNTKRRLVDCSEEAARIFGVSPADFPKTSEEWCQFVHPDDRARAARVFNESNKNLTDYEIEYRIIRSDGETRYVAEIAEHQQRNGSGDVIEVGTIQDITERKLAEAALYQTRDEFEARVADRTTELLRVNERLGGEIIERERAQRELVEKSGLLDGFIEHSRAIVSIKDPAGRYIFVNPEYERANGVSSEQVKGKTNFDIYPKDLATLYSAHEERVIGERRAKVLETTLPHADGTLHTYLTVTFPVLDTEGTPFALGNIDTDITERKRAEEALRMSEMRLRSAQRMAGLAYWDWWYEDQKSEFSAEMATIFGVEPERLKLTDDEYIEMFVHPEDRERVAGVYGLPDDMPRLFDIEYRIVRKDGAIRTIHEAGEPAFDDTGRIIGMAGTTQDITERKHVEEALRRSERHLAESQRIARVGSWDWDTRTDEVRWSDEACRIFGVTWENLGGNLEGFYALVHPEDRVRIACADRDARDHKKSYSIDYRIVRPDGGVFHIFEIGEPECDETGRVVAVKGTLQDVTERKRLEQQLNQAAKLATLGEMAAGIAHEINQPLHIIRMGADSSLLLMEEGQANVEDHEEKFRLISGQAQRMADIIDHMRIFGRVDDEEATRFDPTECVTGAVNMVTDQFRVEGIAISLAMPKLCRAVLGRPVRLEQVMLNLLNNARDAILSNAGRSAKARRAKRKVDVVVSQDDRTGAIHLSVTDSGGGIPQHLIGRVFEPFFTTKEVGTGTGLGLSISYGIIAEMGGTIEARNICNKACFEISLPVCTDA